MKHEPKPAPVEKPKDDVTTNSGGIPTQPPPKGPKLPGGEG
jgi:hypothetical protein